MCSSSAAVAVSGHSRVIGLKENTKQEPWIGGSRQCIVTITCETGWSGIPDVRFDEASSLADGGGGGEDDEDGISFYTLFVGEEKKDPSEECSPPHKTQFFCFHLKTGDHDVVEWSAIHMNNCLYVHVPEGELPQGSKECFVSLLEYAEEQLGCTHAFVCLQKDRKDRVPLMRTFMFMGFETVMPGHQLCPAIPDYVFMAYTIE